MKIVPLTEEYHALLLFGPELSKLGHGRRAYYNSLDLSQGHVGVEPINQTYWDDKRHYDFPLTQKCKDCRELFQKLMLHGMITLHVVLAEGEGQNRQVVGGMEIAYFPAQRLLAVAGLHIQEAHRKKLSLPMIQKREGLLSEIIKHLPSLSKNHQKPFTILAVTSTENPQRVFTKALGTGREEPVSAAKRLALYKMMGAKALPDIPIYENPTMPSMTWLAFPDPTAKKPFPKKTILRRRAAYLADKVGIGMPVIFTLLPPESSVRRWLRDVYLDLRNMSPYSANNLTNRTSGRDPAGREP